MKYLVLMFLMFAFMPVSAQQTDCDDAKKRLVEADQKLNDWAGLKRYEAANKKVMPSKPDENRVVFIGDSITDIWDENGFGGFFPGRPYINRGIGGQTTPQMLLRFRADVID
jgi:hypothetical protein